LILFERGGLLGALLELARQLLAATLDLAHAVLAGVGIADQILQRHEHFRDLGREVERPRRSLAALRALDRAADRQQVLAARAAPLHSEHGRHQPHDQAHRAGSPGGERRGRGQHHRDQHTGHEQSHRDGSVLTLREVVPHSWLSSRSNGSKNAIQARASCDRTVLEFALARSGS
jgi:hypothetical protein